jgi:uncharacterized protein YcbK (DUF882 family)
MPDPSSQNQQPSIFTNPSKSVISRRGLIQKLGLSGAALCASSLQASAGWFWSNDNDIKVVEVKSGSGKKGPQRTDDIIAALPSEWVRGEGNDLKKYIAYLDSLGLKNVSTHHVIAAHAKKRGHVWNKLPPQKWWKRMDHTLQVVDRVASAMNSPVEQIVSAYRCPRYNARCSGAKRQSWHQANVAVDVQLAASPRKVAAMANKLRDNGVFKGGIGTYSGFTHIDTRGRNANW